MTDEQVVVGDVEAGRAQKVKREINKLISNVNTNTFDLAELLYETKTKQYFSDWGFESFSKYAKSLAVKYTKSYYLVKVIALMKGSDVPRTTFEEVGMGKLRIISRLDLEGEYNEVPMPLVIRELTLKARQMSAEEVQFEVDAIMGLVADESMVWENFHLKKAARDNTVRPAIAKMIKFLPQTEGEDGQKNDASKGAALEMICANFLADPNYDTDEDTEITSNIQTPEDVPTESIPLQDLLIPSDETIAAVLGDDSPANGTI